jgi:tyrosine-protein kinase Etk/Wzc
MSEQVKQTSETHKETGPSALIIVVDVFARWWRFIAACVFVAMVASGIVAFLITPQFKGTTTVFPAEKADLFSPLEGVTQLFNTMKSRSIATLAGNPELDRYSAILKSGRVMSAVIEKFDLVHVYKITSYPAENTAKELAANVEMTTEAEGTLTVTVYDEDPHRAADMANYFIEQLNVINADLQVSNARGNREFIEERYKKNIVDLAAAEDSLKMFQKKFGVVAMPQQTDASIKAGAELSAQLAMKEVELAVLRRTLAPENDAVLAAQVEITELKKKIDEMNVGDKELNGNMRALVPLRSIPDLGAEYVRKFRNVEIQFKILQFLMPLYEQAKIEERRASPSVIVLDKAYPAERKSKPRRSLIILGGMFVGLLGSLGFVALADRWKVERDNETLLYRSLRKLSNALVTDVRKMLRRPAR